MHIPSDNEFQQIVKNTPLIAIDLLLENPDSKILLGWRTNSPAKNFWFAPGGRIRKDEDFNNAFERIARAETGQAFSLKNADFWGIYQHLYPSDNFADDPSYGTHYITIAYKIKLEEKITSLPKDQHSDYWWATVSDILADPQVHENTKNYFNGFPSFSE